MKVSILFLVMTIFVVHVDAQKFVCKNGDVSFFSKTPVEDIDANTKVAMILLDTSTGKVNTKMLIKLFMFKNRLMQDHFNENYMESDKYPYAILDAKIMEPVPYYKDGSYNVTLEGFMEIHGVKKPVKINGVINVKGGVISSKSEFMVKLKDYKIDIPKIVVKSIAEEVKVTVNAVFEPFVQRR